MVSSQPLNLYWTTLPVFYQTSLSVLGVGLILKNKNRALNFFPKYVIVIGRSAFDCGALESNNLIFMTWEL
jgi:hypothetical protein